jgi:branched-chain amino acid transport system ATP-binding protein
VVAQLADRITVLQRGRILAQGTYDQVRQNPAVIEAYLGVEGH